MAELSSHGTGVRAPRTVLAGIAVATALAHLALLDAVALARPNPGTMAPRPIAVRLVDAPAERPVVLDTASIVEAMSPRLDDPALEPPRVVERVRDFAPPAAQRPVTRRVAAARRPMNTEAPRVPAPRAKRPSTLRAQASPVEATWAAFPAVENVFDGASIETAFIEAPARDAEAGRLRTAAVSAAFIEPASAETGSAPRAEQLAAAPAAHGGRSADASEALPVYPTRIPAPFRFGYDMSRGMIGGHGELVLQTNADGYEARLQGTVAGFSILDWTSRGGFDDAGFAPLRFVDQRRGRAAQAANFQRATRRITYSGSQVETPLPPGAQDRLSWMLQLAAIARARPERLVQGERITMFVSGARGDADAWTFVVGPPTALDTPAGAVQSIPLERAPRKDYDTRAQVWLDPARQYLPVKARLVSSREGADALELVLEAVQTPP